MGFCTVDYTEAMMACEDEEAADTDTSASVLGGFSFRSTAGMFDTPLTQGCPCPKCSEGRLVRDTDDANWLVCTNGGPFGCYFETREAA